MDVVHERAAGIDIQARCEGRGRGSRQALGSRPSPGELSVEGEDALLLRANSGSEECFHVLVFWNEIPALRNTLRIVSWLTRMCLFSAR
jgi:hypothetical protein